MKKARILIIILSLVILFADRLEASWATFMSNVQNTTARTINFISTDSPLTFINSLTVGANHTFVGLRGASTAILQGGNTLQAFSLSSKIIVFYDKWTFQNFRATDGGVFSSNSSMVRFTSVTISFINNTATQYGGAIYTRGNGFFNFERSTVVFKSNTSVANRGGAIYALEGSFLNFTSSTVIFELNSATGEETHGGAVYVGWNANKKSSITFSYSRVSFSSNSTPGTGSLGGSLYMTTGDSQAYFINSNVNFSSNVSGGASLTGRGGGAIGLWSEGKVNILSSTVSFFGNKANSGSGGAINIHGNPTEAIFRDSKIDFTSNSAQYGGAIFLYAALSSLLVTNSNVAFIRNNASIAGGAIHNTWTIDFKNATINFTSNSANSQGGAIYTTSNSSLTFNAGGQILFRDNTMGTGANKKVNDIYMDGGRLYLIANQYQIRMEGGIWATNNSDISYSNTTGNWYLSGWNVFDNMGIFSIGAQSSITVANAIWTYRNSPRWEISGGSTINFINSSVTFAANSAALYVSNASLFKFNNSTINFLSNGAYGASGNDGNGVAIFIQSGGRVNFSNSKAIFLNNGATYGTIYIGGGGATIMSFLAFDRSTVSFNLSSASANGGVLHIQNNSSVTFTRSSISFTNNYSNSNGGAIYATNTNQTWFIDNPFILFENNKAAANSGGIYLGSSANSMYFLALNTDSLLIFRNNKLNDGGLNDIYIANAGASLIFNAAAGRSINLTNGLRTDGTAGTQLRKTGGGKVVFSGDNSVIKSTFNVLAGTAVFHSAKSTINVLAMSAGTMLDLRGGSTSTLFITGAGTAFVLNGHLGLDFRFAVFADHPSKSTSDFIYAAGNINIQASSLLGNISIADAANTLYGSSIAFMRGASINGEINLSAPTGYAIVKNNNILWLVYGGTDPWNSFVSLYRLTNADVLELGQDINAWNGSFSFGDPQSNNKKLTVNGKFHVVNSSGFANKGFVIMNSSITFRDIVWTSFVRTGGHGGVMNVFNSTVIFRGSISWINNSAAEKGGALFAWEYSNINFINSIVKFTSNAAMDLGGAISALDSSNIAFTSSALNFTANKADWYGGAIHAGHFSNIAFTSSTLNFTANEAVLNGGAIFVSDFSNIAFTSSVVNFTSNAAAIEGGALAAIHYSSINFRNSSVAFIGNKALNNGGALFIDDEAIVNFTSSTVNFSSNTARGSLGGGAIYAEDAAIINFTSSAVNFSSNSANRGGAIYAGQSAIINFTSGAVVFSSNAARGSSGGAAIYAVDAAIINFTSGAVSFAYNNALVGYGAAISALRSRINFIKATVNFTSNTAYEDGGAIYMELSTMNWIGGSAVFEDSYAYYGGALALERSKFVVEDATMTLIRNEAGRVGAAFNVEDYSTVLFSRSSITFANNAASNNGGALFANMKSSISFITAELAAGQTARSAYRIVFFGNKAGAKPNDIHLDNAQLWMSGSVWMEGGIIAIAKSTISYSGRHWHLSGINDFDDMGMFSIGAKSSVTVVNAIWTYKNSLRWNIIDGSTITFSKSSVSFVKNAAGSMQITGYSRVYFDNSTINFLSKDTFNDTNLQDTFFITMGGYAYFINSRVNFLDNKQRNGSIYVGNSAAQPSSFLIFERSTITVHLSSSNRNGGGMAIQNGSSTTFMRSSISFVKNYTGGSGGAIYATETNNVWFIDNPFILFENNRVVTNGGAIHLASAQSSMTFSALNADTKLIFNDNKLNNGVLNDIYIANAGASFVFDAAAGRSINLTNGLRTDGVANNQIKKTGGGRIVFSGDASIIKSTINVLAGTAVFHSAKSTINFLAMSAGAMLDLRGGGYNQVFVRNSSLLSLSNIWMGFDFYFDDAVENNNRGDWLEFSGDFGLSQSSIAVNILQASAIVGRRIPFIKAQNLTVGLPLMYLTGVSVLDYRLNSENNILYLLYYGNNAWDVFVNKYKNQTPNGAAADLAQDIYAWGDAALSFGDPQDNGRQNITVDGKFHIVHSSGFINKGFVIANSSITFRDIKFTSFSRTAASGSGNGGVMNISNSTMVFRGTASWINNAAAAHGGALYASRSSLSFVNANISFTSNAAKTGVGGAVYIYDRSVFNVIRTTVSFSWNMAGAAGSGLGGGGLALSTNSQANFIDSKTIFEGNEASRNATNPWSGAIWALYGSTVNFSGGEAYFKKNNADGSGGGGYGGAIIMSALAGKGNRAIFENMRVLEFSSNTARFGGGAIYIYQAGAYLAIKNNAQVFFFGNETLNTGYGGGAIGLSVAGGSLMEIVNNSSVVFRGNKTARFGGAIHLGMPSRLNFENTAGQWIVFENNQQLAGTQQNDIYINAAGSTLSMTIAGQIKTMSGFQAIAGTIFKTGAGTWTASGLNILSSLDVPLNLNGTWIIENATFTWTAIGTKGLRLQAGAVLEIKDSSAAFMGGAVTGGFGGGITINNVSAKFSAISRDVNLYFNSNTKDAVSNDIYLSNAAGWLVLDAADGKSIKFNNGLRMDGAAGSQVNKTGGGTLFFGGADTVIKNRFDVFAGTVIFRAAQSTVSVLNISDGAALDLRDGITTNTVFIESGDISADALLGFDFGFDDGGTNQWSDKLIASGALNISSAVVFANIISFATIYGSSIAFAQAATLDVLPSDLTLRLTAASGMYHLDVSDHILWLVFGSGAPWDQFVTRYRSSQAGDTVYLYHDIEAFPGAYPLNIPSNPVGDFAVEGSGFTANALNNPDLGFLLIGSSITFRNIHLSNFVSTSSVRKGGAMTVIDSLIFMEGNFMFFNNVSSDTDALGGGAIYIENSTAYFSAHSAPMRLIFKNNLAPAGQDIYAINSSLIFDASAFHINMENGLRMAGGGKIIKTGTKDLIFDGEDSVLTSIDIEQGAVIFKPRSSSVESIDVKSSGTLSLGNGGFNNLRVDALLSSGTLNLDMDFTFRQALGDVIFGGSVSIASGSALTINPIRRQTWVYGSSGTIIFTNYDGLSLNISDIFYDRNLYKLFRTDDSLVIMFIGSDFPKLDLTHNQNEAYVLLKKVVDMRRSGNFGFFAQSSDFKELIEESDAVIRDVLSGDADDMRRALDALSGSFLAQAIVQVAADSPHNLLYSKVIPFSLDGLPKREDRARSLTLKSFWTDIGAKVSKTSDEKNLLGDFNKASAQAAVGLTFIETTDISAGAFASFSGSKMEQGGNEAEVESYEGGFYGGSFSELFSHKYFAAFAYHNVLTKREVDLGRGYKPKANFELYGLKAGGESAVALNIFRKLDIALHVGMLGSFLYNDEINEVGGGAIGLTAAPANYQRFEGYAGLKLVRRNWHIAAEAGYLFYGNLDESRFGMFMSGFSHKMEIEGSNVNPLSFALKFGTDKRLSDDVYVQTLGGIEVDRDLGGKRAGLNISLKYLFPTRMSAEVYREMASKYDPYLLKKEFRRAREEVLLDEETDWVNMSGVINPDEEGEKYLMKRSEGKNRLAVHVLAEKDGALMWRTFIISDMKIFPENDSELPPSLINNIRDKMDEMEAKKMKIARVRIARYGHFIDDKEIRFAELWAQGIYREILSYKDEMAAVKAANLKKELELRERRDREKADKIQRELEEKNRRRQEAELKKQNAADEKLKEAQQRREKSIIAYKLKAASFEAGRSRLSQEALKNIDDLVERIKGSDWKMITVEGHTDSTGLEAQNRILAEQRAAAVYMELLKRGIPANKARVSAFGSSMPIADNAAPEGRAANRRVEIFVE